MSNRYPPPPRIDGGCITKDTGTYQYHYHTNPFTPEVKEWYLNSGWTVADKFCQQRRGRPAQKQDPYDWQFDD